MAKPLLNFFYPELTGFVQPLAGEFAAHRELLGRIPFATGYGVEIAMMVDVLTEAGLLAMAQVDLETRQNRHQPLFDLTRMSSAVLRALGRRVQLAGRGAVAHDPSELLARPRQDVYLHAVGTADGLRLDEHLVELLERPPLTQVLAAGAERDTVALSGRKPRGATPGGKPRSRRSRRRRRRCRPRPAPAGGTCPP
jgi:glucosyl-3-phosphoglycerate synthase